MSDAWIVILLLTLTTMVLKFIGPLILGHRELPGWAMRVFTVLPAALLTALIVVQVMGQGDRVVVDERLVGLAAAGGVLAWRRGAIAGAVVAAMLATALTRALL